MGAAAYVGRVGALAVALGVGVAVATGYGVASADPSGAGSSSLGEKSAETTSSEKKSSPATPAEGPASPTGTPSSAQTQTQAPTNGKKTASRAKKSGLPVAKLPRSSLLTPRTNDQPPAATLPAATPPSGTQETQPAGGTSKGQSPTTTGKATLESAYTAKTPRTSLKAADAKVTVDAPATTLRTIASDALNAVAPRALKKSALPEPADATPVTAATQKTALVAPSALAPASVTPTVGLPGVVTTVLSALGLAPLAANAPAAPAQSAALWGLLAWARREIDQGFSNLLKSAGTPNPAIPTETVDLALKTVGSGTADALAMTADAPAALLLPPPHRPASQLRGRS